MSVIPCDKNAELSRKIEEFAEILRTRAHELGGHGMAESEFYNSGLFRGAIERIRGQFSAIMREKREFVRHVLNHLQDHGFVANWDESGDANRHDYSVEMPSGRIAVIELKGCLDGNNTTIFERPPHANEFVIWSVCTNPGADPRHNVWSGIHTRLSAEIIHRSQRVDGVIIWDMACGTLGRPCPKLQATPSRLTILGPYKLPPPCIYVLPPTIPSPRNNPAPKAQAIHEVELLKAFHECFQGVADEISYVDFSVEYRGADLLRTTTVRRAGRVQRQSKATPIQRA